MKKYLFLLFTALVVASCSKDDKYSLDFFTDTYGPSSSKSSAGSSDTLLLNITYNETSATLSGNVDGVTVSVNGADVVVNSQTDKYLLLTLSGTATDGSLLVYSQKKYGIVLNGVNLTNADGPAINNQCGKALNVTCAANTTNTLTDGEAYGEAPVDANGASIDQKGVLFSEGQIYFDGMGTLTLNGNAKNGIASDDYITIEEGVINVNVAKTGSNGIKVNDGFIINNGTLTINVEANGARGIKNDSYTTINGGTITITTSGDCKSEIVDDVEDITSCAGIKCDSLFTMTDGTLTITSTGDGGKGINCSQNIEMSGGTLTVKTTGTNLYAKPKGVKSDTEVILSGGRFESTVLKSKACESGDRNWPTIKGTPSYTNEGELDDEEEDATKKHVLVIF